ncbi:MAG: hypothetical protein FJY37_13915 [Betaproteobacteria bacterium]|nr:hypothetical protein [Betaproteobacteria bacterium]
MKCALLSVVALLMIGLSNVSKSSPILEVLDGVLVGAQGVNVQGIAYKVSFQDESCVVLFSGCDEPGDFPFTNGAMAEQASRSLLAQVLVDGPSGQFDSFSGTVRGCQFIDGCWILTPYLRDVGHGVNVALARNFEPVNGDPDSFDLAYTGTQVGIDDPVGGGAFPSGTVGYTHAVWTCDPCTPIAPIQEPKTLALLLSMIVAFAVFISVTHPYSRPRRDVSSA